VEVTLTDNRSYPAKVIGTDPKSDLAVIKIEGKGFPTVELANSDNVRIGEWVLAVGNPFELNSTVTAGIVSAKGRNISLLGGGEAIESFIQTDAAVNPGNSGGALVDQEGRLVGINTAIATRTGVFQGYSFAIPINLVKRIADDIIKYGSYQRAYLGVSISELDGEYADQLGVRINQGVVIERIFNGGSAEYAGLAEKDIITAVDGVNVKSVPELQEYIGRSRVGDTVNLTINREGAVREVPVKLKAQIQEGE
jgi:S1-C subfamily serine protease